MTPIDNVYTKHEVDSLIAQAKEEAHEADRILMAKHNRNATIISMILGFICLALFLDGLLRIMPSLVGSEMCIRDRFDG